MFVGRDMIVVIFLWFMYEMCCYLEIVDKIYEEGVVVIGKYIVVESVVEYLMYEVLG